MTRLTVLALLCLAVTASTFAGAASASTPEYVKTCLEGTPPAGKPTGYPCKPFENQASVLSYTKQLLIDNGFRRAGLQFWLSPRQVSFRGIQDGYGITGRVVKSGLSQITIQMTEDPTASDGPEDRSGGTYKFDLPFRA